MSVGTATVLSVGTGTVLSVGMATVLSVGMATVLSAGMAISLSDASATVNGGETMANILSANSSMVDNASHRRCR